MNLIERYVTTFQIYRISLPYRFIKIHNDVPEGYYACEYEGEIIVGFLDKESRHHSTFYAFPSKKFPDASASILIRSDYGRANGDVLDTLEIGVKPANWDEFQKYLKEVFFE